ncbi:MAG: transposase, partial [Cyanobacteria bacterium P01_D01_bin.128]
LGSATTFGVEGTGSYGRGLTTFLLQQGCSVVEVCRPARRISGQSAAKDDGIDAEKAARQVLSRQATVTPKRADGPVEMMRIIKIAKDTAVKAQTQVLVALKSLLVTADATLRTQLESLPTAKLVAACAELAITTMDTPMAAMGYALAKMAQRWQALQQEIDEYWKHLKGLTQQTAPALTEACGIGPDTAAQMLITFGDRGDRVRSEAGFAKLCGVCPIPASSGKTQRHRLNRGGNRQANAALFRVVIVRMRWHQPTQDYVARRTAQGLSKREIIRCLKRYVAREVYRLIRQALPIEKVIANP